MERLLKYINNQIISLDDFNSYYNLVSPKKWMLVCDKSFDFLPTKIKKIYEDHKENCVLFNDFEPNPKYESIEKGVEIINNCFCSLIVAIGGGSTIDVAKCVKLFSGLKNKDSMLTQKPNYEFNCKINLIALPTTAGTGSESTKHAVIYYNGIKQSICDNAIIPDAIILEPDVLLKLPSLHKKASLLDALCQACESWWSNASTEESIKFSKYAINTIVDKYEEYINGNNECGLDILKSANYAGRAINITKTTAAHAMSYKLSSLFNIPHGISVALCFPVVWKHMLNKADESLMRKFQVIAFTFGTSSPENAIEKFYNIIKKMDIKSPVSDNRKNDIDILVDSVNPERLSNNPVIFTKDELKEMYGEIIK